MKKFIDLKRINYGKPKSYGLKTIDLDAFSDILDRSAREVRAEIKSELLKTFNDGSHWGVRLKITSNNLELEETLYLGHLIIRVFTESFKGEKRDREARLGVPAELKGINLELTDVINLINFENKIGYRWFSFSIEHKGQTIQELK